MSGNAVTQNHASWLSEETPREQLILARQNLTTYANANAKRSIIVALQGHTITETYYKIRIPYYYPSSDHKTCHVLLCGRAGEASHNPRAFEQLPAACQQTFGTEGDLRQHLKTHSNTAATASSSSGFRATSQMSDIERHENTTPRASTSGPLRELAESHGCKI